MYARSGMMEDAHKAFDMLFEKNLISYNTIDIGIGASAFTFASLLSGAASIGAVGKGEQIHARLLKSGFASTQSICNALISMYSRCGNIEAAFQVFNDMGGRNVISWTSMITGFAKHGFASKAMEMSHKMLEDGVRPNEITYIAVLSGIFSNTLYAKSTSPPPFTNISINAHPTHTSDSKYPLFITNPKIIFPMETFSTFEHARITAEKQYSFGQSPFSSI
ncbi:pentatricopeptide repeat-containing protein [Quercus suber]|uniref:Pentatricopeptide repeat-containing protein n=1 Tax=Quercus suber TaxID=58331 RepID=A0AAW0J8U1_QUESU